MQGKLEQLERLRSEDTPHRLMITHTIESYWISSQKKTVKVTNLKNLPFWNKLYTWHTFWSCLIRCANMKWIRWVLLKIQSGHDSVHRRTDGRTRWNQYTHFQLRWRGGYNKLTAKRKVLSLLNSSSSKQWKLHSYLTMVKNEATDITTHPLIKMATDSQTIFSDAFSWMKIFVFWLKSHWSLLLRV